MELFNLMAVRLDARNNSISMPKGHGIGLTP